MVQLDFTFGFFWEAYHSTPVPMMRAPFEGSARSSVQAGDRRGSPPAWRAVACAGSLHWTTSIPQPDAEAERRQHHGAGERIGDVEERDPGREHRPPEADVDA